MGCGDYRRGMASRARSGEGYERNQLGDVGGVDDDHAGAGDDRPLRIVDGADQTAVEKLGRGGRGAEKTESEADTQNAET